MKITPVERAARIKVLREKRKLEHEGRVRERAARLRSKKLFRVAKSKTALRKNTHGARAGR
jgi:hypothetical protein